MKTAPANNYSSYLLKEVMSKNGRLSHPKWNMTSSKWKKSSPKLEDNLTQNGRHHSQWSKVAIFFQFFQLQATLAPSKMSSPNSRYMKYNRNFMLKTMESSDFSLVENPWRDFVFSKIENCKPKKVDFHQNMTFFSFW